MALLQYFTTTPPCMMCKRALLFGNIFLNLGADRKLVRMFCLSIMGVVYLC